MTDSFNSELILKLCRLYSKLSMSSTVSMSNFGPDDILIGLSFSTNAANRSPCYCPLTIFAL